MGKINSVILGDDSADGLGVFFLDMKNATDMELRRYSVENQNITETRLLGCNCDRESLTTSVALVNEQPFLFFVYAHGKKDAILVNGESVISTTDNFYILSNALVYTFSCHNGGELADKLILNEAKLFVGYKGKANCPCGLDELTGKIALSFISAFLEGKSARESFKCLHNAYSLAVRDASLDPFQRAAYQENRDNLVIKGEQDMMLKDFVC